MQVVGKNCEVTGRKIMTDKERIGCLSCDLVYLRESVPGNICPKCNQDMASMAEQRHANLKKEQEADHARGRRLFEIMLVLLLVMETAALSLPGLKGPTIPALSLALLLPVWFGYTWARVALMGLMALHFPGLWTVFQKDQTSSNPTSVIVVALLAALTIAVLILLCNPKLSHYLDSKRKAPN